MPISGSLKVKLASFVLFAVLTTLALPLSAQTVEQGIALFNAKKYLEAKTALQPFGSRDASAAFYLGQIEMGDNSYDKATDWFEKAVQLNPRNAVYYDWLGRAYGRQAQHANKLRLPFLARKTKNAWDTALALDPDNLDVREDLITYYTEAPGFLGGSKDKAREMAAEIKKRNSYRGSIVVANLCAGEKDTVCVERELVDMTTSYPDSAGGVASLAAFYANHKEYDKAFSLLDQRSRAKPNEPAILFQIGRTAALSGQNLDRGETALKAYLALPPAPNAPAPANAHYRLGMIYEKKKATNLAREEYRTALQLNPRLEDAKKALSTLGK